jgi:ribosomal protein L40E
MTGTYIDAVNGAAITVRPAQEATFVRVSWTREPDGTRMEVSLTRLAFSNLVLARRVLPATDCRECGADGIEGLCALCNARLEMEAA